MSKVVLPLKTHLMSTLSFKLRPTGTTSISTSRTEKIMALFKKKKQVIIFFVCEIQSHRTYYAFIERRLSSARSASVYYIIATSDSLVPGLISSFQG